MDFEIEFASVSQVGRRKSNQDTYCSEQLTSDIFLFGVADGMGGSLGGEIASEIAIETLKLSILEQIELLYESPDNIEQCFNTAIKKIQEAISARAMDELELKGMGTTLVVLLLVEDYFAVCHVGDSRAYLYSSLKDLEALTIDHSFVQESMKQANAATISPDFLKRHDHIITRVLDGGKDSAEISDVYNIMDLGLESFSFVLCSDGLILDKFQSPQYIADILRINNRNELEKCNLLTNYAFENGSNDNITAIVVSLKNQPSDEQVTQVGLKVT